MFCGSGLVQDLLCRVGLSVAMIVIHQITIAHICKVHSLIVVVDGFCEARTVKSRMSERSTLSVDGNCYVKYSQTLG